MKIIKLLLLLQLLLLPAYSLMLRPGIFTMHDFHVFRQQQFDKCLHLGYFPCRWAFDATRGYGQPLFNFYGQLPYWIGQIPRLLGTQIIDAAKLNFIFTLTASAVAMFFLARKFWGNTGGVVSAVFYTYAPYRAVDIWVRGALNEAYSFVWYPLILLFLDNYLERKQKKDLFWLIIFSTALLITHNLSMLMIAPFLAIWTLKKLKAIPGLIAAGLTIFLLSAFYLLPVVFESSQVTLTQTTQDYYSYQLHWTTLKQLFVSNFWGYGGSTWGPNDTLSFSVGYLQWILPLLLMPFLFRNKKFVLPVVLGFMAVFLTHGKSEFIWKLIPPMSYIQFPWRFLTVSTFFLSLACGAVSLVVPRRFIPLLLLLLLLLNIGFFKPDIWRTITDKEQFSGALWDEQRSSAISDFWPKEAKIPTNFAPQDPLVLYATDQYQKVQFPTVYFPGWKLTVDGQPTEVFPSGPSH
ncbi:MAG: hypothetical protein UV10_C0034G0003 [Candidatus Azambacteria bacterium GW2011_GWA1_42_19]|uniref:Membrane protein 6-pyruvoyl-tetrahydropterin synthase-related domain-containing protein n=1 Tax=Candidatus Azambacteria bacterium GW2011_GWA1_42_19 TaxID=1618609 RepID=A0A0G1C645_9BACT|nr:MAG: hypothetical protein UV10_C0034G0003 [Candidatus Azambacteria bacterium GW2011_GWA1_42_19]